jgi:hypothetical protein
MEYREASSLLLHLSPELIFQIVDYTHPSTILALALTCSTLYQQCQPVLEKHRDSYKKYRVTSDLSPETVVDLLKDTPAAKIERWHVRELEVWGSRESWQDWRSWVPKLPGAYGLTDEDPSRSALDAREVQRYVRTGIDWWEFSGDDIKEVQRNLESGSDAYLKLLLIASCPRLHSIRFVKREHDTWTSLQWIGRAIRWSKTLNGKWPPGFESLQSIAVGISTGLSSSEEEVSEHNSVFAELFHIPNLKNLYYHDLFQDREEEEDEDFDFEEVYDFPVGTSSIENLFLDSAYNLSPDFYDAIASAPEKLETIVIRAPNSTVESLNDFDSFVNVLAKKCPQLERLVIYNCAGLHGYRCSSYLPEELNDFWNIKQITIAAGDIELEAYYNLNGHATLESLGEEWIQEAFPSNMEAMYVTGKTDIYKYEFNSGKPSETLDSLLALLIESGTYEDLKVIYVENAESSHRQPERDIALGSPIIAGREELAFQKTLVAGRKAGVHVCTLMNRDDDGGYWKNFPARPDRFDLKTGPCAGERPAEWKLNLCTGEWGPDCMGCGECQECLVVYPPELWKKNAAAA